MSNRGAARISCARCGSNNFADAQACWQCKQPLAPVPPAPVGYASPQQAGANMYPVASQGAPYVSQSRRAGPPLIVALAAIAVLGVALFVITHRSTPAPPLSVPAMPGQPSAELSGAVPNHPADPLVSPSDDQSAAAKRMVDQLNQKVQSDPRLGFGLSGGARAGVNRAQSYP